ncbi:TonB-dependent receptor family protein [Jiulongibacter sp. NS-SX5]|uniref:TonB-dependent receptor family protein n=1 Tax=Jiulongibacter sp. NS-SX5 TaxID=3463854 RepID=UPI004059A47C
MQRLFILALTLLFTFDSNAQVDTTQNLEQVNVKAFSSDKSVTEVAAPVHVISKPELDRFENQGFANIINQYPGVRMEERSPGSYRLSIRGSSVRSPFGVRNIKVYWNNIPLTDADGITYFNQLDMNTFQGLEIVRGPSASNYGAGMGGVILLDTKAGKLLNGKKNKVHLNTHFGSFGTQNSSITFTSANSKSNTLINYSRAATDGFRDHSAMQRNVLNLRTSFYLNDKHTIHLFSFFGDLNYQTPGGLTYEQMLENPRWARQETRFTPSSEAQKAAIDQNLITFGVSQDFKFNNRVSSELSVFGTRYDLENPFITNYEFRDQRSIGLRSNNIFKVNDRLRFMGGFEILQTNSNYEVFDNDGGTPAAPQFEERIQSTQQLIFAQMETELLQNLILNAGVSLNQQVYDYARINGLEVNEKSGVPLMPRVSLLKKIGGFGSIFGSISGGFSPPTAQELIANFEDQNSQAEILNAESGVNYEIGYKLNRKTLQFEINTYLLDVNNAIIREVNADGRDRFRNSGKSMQKGLETYLSWRAACGESLNLLIKGGVDLKSYTYTEFSDREEIYDGNLIPSVPSETYTLQLDLNHKSGLYWNNNLSHLGEMPLNNANTVFADPFTLINSRLGYRLSTKTIDFNLYSGLNNILNQRYSLGYDINAFGNRYYNPSPSRNWNAGASVAVKF